MVIPHRRRRRRLASVSALALFASLSVLVPQSALAAPLAVVGGPYLISEGAVLNLDGSGSSGATSWAWDLDSDGQFDDAFGMTPSVLWSRLVELGVDDDGSYAIGLQTGDGVTTHTSTSLSGLTVTNTAPTITIAGSAYAATGQPLDIGIDVTDPGNDTISNWTVNWGDGSIDATGGAPSWANHSYPTNGSYVITVSVDDEDGTWADTKSVVVTSGLVVNSSGNAGDATAGNGVCSTGSTNSQGDPACTLRAAIQEANALAGFDVIFFDLPQTESGYGSSPERFTLQPTSLLPEVSTPMYIDGSSQPEYTTNRRPVIEIDGTSVSAGEENGLWITGGGSTIRGLVVNNFGDDAIDVEFLGGNTIVGNYVGTDVTGTIAEPNAWGINIKTPGNIVGGTSVVDRNVVSGNTNDGLHIKNSTAIGNILRGNYLGTTANGNAPLPNASHGINVFNSASATLIEANVVSGNGGAGVYVTSEAADGTHHQRQHDRSLGRPIHRHRQRRRRRSDPQWRRRHHDRRQPHCTPERGRRASHRLVYRHDHPAEHDRHG